VTTVDSEQAHIIVQLSYSWQFNFRMLLKLK
jgi:hypothetical protein